MKCISSLLFIFLFYVFSSISFAACGGRGCGFVMSYGHPCLTNCPLDNVCQCTDPGVNFIDPRCMDRCTYCEAFGNVGAR